MELIMNVAIAAAGGLLELRNLLFADPSSPVVTSKSGDA
jgi:hypothetical protein